MKHFFLALLTVATIGANAQTAEQIVDKHIAFLGGPEPVKKAVSLKMSGTVSVQGMDLPITIVILNGKGFRSDVEVMGTSVISAYTNGVGWTQNQFAGMPEPTELSGDKLIDLQYESNLGSPLTLYKTQGNKIELVGKEKAEGRDAYKLKLLRKEDGKNLYFFIDANDYSLIKSVAKQDVMGDNKDVETVYSNPKDVNGMKIYMTMAMKVDGTQFQAVSMDTAEVNVPVDAKIFAKP